MNTKNRRLQRRYGKTLNSCSAWKSERHNSLRSIGDDWKIIQDSLCFLHSEPKIEDKIERPKGKDQSTEGKGETGWGLNLSPTISRKMNPGPSSSNWPECFCRLVESYLIHLIRGFSEETMMLIAPEATGLQYTQDSNIFGLS